MKVNIELEPNDIQEINEMIDTWMGISLTEAQIHMLMDSEQDILLQMAQYGISDTPTREELMHAIGERIVGREYPSRENTTEYEDEFWADFDEKAREAGFKVTRSRT